MNQNLVGMTNSQTLRDSLVKQLTEDIQFEIDREIMTKMLESVNEAERLRQEALKQLARDKGCAEDLVDAVNL